MKILIVLYLAMLSLWVAAETQWISDVEPNPLTFTEFGKGLAVMEDWLVVGDPFNDDEDTNAGAIHVYKDVNGQWLHSQTLYPVAVDMNDSLANDEFGSSVDIERNHITGETWIVGATVKDDQLNLDNGAVYLYNLVDQGMGQFAFEFQKKIVGENFQINRNFGTSVAINLDYIPEVDANLWVLVIGDDTKVYEVNGTPSSTGGINVYKKTDAIGNTFWEEETVQLGMQYLDGLTGGDQIGFSVAIDGGTIVAGAPGDDDHALPGTDGGNMGAIHVFQRDNLTQTWGIAGIIFPDNRERTANFGYSVDVIKQPNNNRIIMGGAPFERVNNSPVGSVYVWFNSLQVQRLQPQVTAGNSGEFYGSTLAANGDAFLGTNQFIVGSPYSNTDQGLVYHYMINPLFDGLNELYLLKDTTVAFDNSINPWTNGRFGSKVATDGRTHVARSRANLVGNHSKVYSQEYPIFTNGFESMFQQ
ncbi:FG-GAP repeat protein [Marinicella litoralis]|uniref:FG-GAP repeat protein n=1 Tax=Marinicella litoralis TaxID=644220 RepID=A0A4R6XX51_9GAMM|nr:FG-GAP repeat protein [Marinicella litoralis]TDR22757.1 FG-GAP repeat protein [Marinicella litoralis]